VSTFRSHPALAGWYTVDERPPQDLPQIEARLITRAVQSHPPTFRDAVCCSIVIPYIVKNREVQNDFTARSCRRGAISSAGSTPSI
jgi:hypothetical protein